MMHLCRKPRLLQVLTVLAACFLATSRSTGSVTVVPEDDDVAVGSNYTIYCKINRTNQTISKTSQDLVWHRGYPPFTSLASANPKPLPTNVQSIINDTTKSITLMNLQKEDTDYYYCYLRGEEEFENTDNCDVHVIEPPPKLNLACGAYSRSSFYCWWPIPDTHYKESFNATYGTAYGSQRNSTARQMGDCEHFPTPDVPDGSETRCVRITNYSKVNVTVVATNPLGSSTTKIQFHIVGQVVPLPLDNLDVTPHTHGFHVSGGPPPHWEVHLQDTGYLHYELEYKQDGTDDWVVVETDVNNELNYDVTSLHPNTFYTVRARSVYLDDRKSDYSPEIIVKTLGTVPLGFVDDLRREEQIDHSDRYSRTVVITWQGLEEEEKGSDNFVYYVEVIGGDSSQVVFSDAITETTFVTPKISRFRAYEVHVIPGNNVGNYTDGMAKTSIHDESGTPGIPGGLTWEARNTSAGILSWEDPEVPNSIITQFNIQWEMEGSINGRLEDTLQKMEGEERFRYIVTGLVTYKRYSFRVCAVNVAGMCGQTAFVEGRSKQGVPESPPSGFFAEGRNSPESLQLKWTEPRGAHNGIILFYEIEYCVVKEEECIGGRNHTFNAVNTDQTRHTYHLEGLEPYTQYRLSMCAATIAGCSPYTDTIQEWTAQGTPESPRNLRLVSLNSTWVQLEWDPPLKMNGKLDGYQVFCRDCKTGSSRRMVDTTTVGLEVYGDTDVVIGVKACSHADVNPCSLKSELTAHTPIGKPSAPQNLDPSELSFDKIRFSWSAPEHPNGVIAYYSISQRSSSDEAWQEYDRVTNTSMTVMVDCRSGGVMYDFSVAAVTVDGTTQYIGDSAQTQAKMCTAIRARNVIIMFVLVPIIALVVVSCLVSTIRYHLRVKRNLPDPYFIDAVKSSIYGQKTWTCNESQFFIVERESFDPLRCVDDSTQLLSLDRMYLTEGSTSSSDQGIHDMDGHLTSTGSCTRLVPEDKADVRLGGRRPLRVLSEDYDKDADFNGDDAVFPEDTDNYGPSDSVTASLSYAGAVQIGTPPNSPASLTASNHSSDRGDSGHTSCCSETTKYAKLTEANLSPSSTLDNSSRPLSSASEDSMSYTRIGENSSPPNSATSNPDVNLKPSQDLPEVVFNDQVTPSINLKEEGADSGMDQVFKSTEDLPSNGQHHPGCQGVRAVPRTPDRDANRSPSKARLPSSDSSSDELSGYCKQDVTGLTDAVTSSGVSSIGEDYSRIAEGSGEVLSPLPSGSGYPLDVPPPYSLNDPYVTNQEMEAKEDLLQHNSPISSGEPSPSVETSPYTSPYVTSEHAV